jgi:outer membrane receptor protein involved in Fe transport
MFIRYALFISATLIAPLIYSQTNSKATADEILNLEETIVIGSRLDLTLQEVTDSVELMNDDRFKNEVVFNIADAVSRAANTSITGSNLNSISIRGISKSGTNGAGQGSAVAVYLDGVPTSSDAISGGGQSLWDVEQLEVLRGSQSTIQGRNAIAGAIVVQSKQPTYDWQGAVRLMAAERGATQYSGMVSGPLIDDELAMRLSINDDNNNGYVNYAFDGSDADYRNVLSTRASLLFEPKALPALRAYITAQYEELEAGQSPGRVSAPLAANDRDFLNFDPSDFETFRDVIRSSEADITRSSADLSYELSESMTLKLLSSLEQSKFDGINGSRSTSVYGEVGGLFTTETIIHSHDLSLSFDLSRWTGLVGVYYFEQKQDVTQINSFIIGEVLPFDLDPIDSLARLESELKTKADNLAFYTQWRFSPNNSWDLDIGLRYDSEEFETQRGDTVASVLPSGCLANLGGGFIDCDIAAVGFNMDGDPIQSDDYAALLPRAGVTFNVDDNLSFFASIRRGYRAGGAGIAFTDSVSREAVVYTYDPEFLTGYEAGWRSLWMDGRLVFNGTLFYSDYEDQQVNVEDAAGFVQTINAGETHLYGLELSTEFEITDYWSFYANLGLLETKIDKFIYDEFSEPAINLKGNELDSAPGISTTLGLVYKQPEGLFGSLSLNYETSSWSDVFNLGSTELVPGVSERVPSAYIVNARLGYRYKDLIVTSFVTNLLDENGPENLNFADANALNGNGGFRSTGEYNMRQPQTFGLSVEYLFD